MMIKRKIMFDSPPVGAYVYLHRRLSDGQVFYVGKSANNPSRCKSFGKDGADSYRKSKLWQRTARKHGVAVEIVMDNLQEWYANELEIELIAYYGRLDVGEGCLVNHTDGGEGSRRLWMHHPKADKKVYSLFHVITDEKFVGTRQEFYKFFNTTHSNMQKMFMGESLASMGWAKEENRLKIEISRSLGGVIEAKKGRIYVLSESELKARSQREKEKRKSFEKVAPKFVFDNGLGLVLKLTKKQFIEKYNASREQLNSVIRGEKNYRTIKGFSVSAAQRN